MLWLALHLPLLSLEAFCAATVHRVSDPAAQPVALVAGHLITEVNAAAATRGIRAGMKRATALALAADLLLGEASPARDAAALTAVAHAALAFTPSVTLQDGPATVLMEVQASLRLFGGLVALLEKLREALAPLSHRVQIAAAPTALGAAMLARWGLASAGVATVSTKRSAGTAAGTDAGTAAGTAAGTTADRRRGPGPGRTVSFDPVLGPHATRLVELVRLLERAPVWLLGPAREHWEALQGMGLRTLSDLRALPRAGLARRFGEGLLEDLDRALGRAPDPRTWIELPTRFETKLELHQRADNTDQVLTAAAVLLARLVAWAQARHGRIAAFTLSMQHEPRRAQRCGADSAGTGSEVHDVHEVHEVRAVREVREVLVVSEVREGHEVRVGGGEWATELRIELAEPALDPAHLQLLLRERLAQVRLAAPTLELRLRCRDLVAGAPPNGELFPTRASETLGLARLLERLRARLGDAQVQRLEPVADHRPERASRSVPALEAGRTGGAPPPHRQGLPEDSALPLHRPVWLLPEPLPLAERHALPLLDGQPLQLVSGPERIEAGWWDGAPAARDYFIALAADGSLVWVWRRRLPAAQAHGHGEGGEAEVQWMLQGRFA